MLHILLLMIVVAVWRSGFIIGWQYLLRSSFRTIWCHFFRSSFVSIWRKFGRRLVLGLTCVILYPLYFIWYVAYQLFSYPDFLIIAKTSKSSRKMLHIVSQERFYRNFFVSLGMGLAFTVVLYLFQHSYILPDVVEENRYVKFIGNQLQAIEDEDMDSLMEFRRFFPNLLTSKHERKFFITDPKTNAKINTDIPGFLFLDIDDKTHLSWGSPPFTPRDLLRNLINAAVEAKAKMVIVDVDLSPDIHPGTKELSQPEQELKRFLKEHRDTCKVSQGKWEKGCRPVPIILVRTFSSLEKENEKESNKGENAVVSEHIHKPFEPNSSFLDEVVTKQSSPYVQWASAEFFASHHITRRWWLWQPVCEKQQLEAIPSIELLAATMVCNNTQELHRMLDEAVKPSNPESPTRCEDFKPSSTLNNTFTICGKKVTGGEQGIQQRIIYSMSWQSPKEYGLIRYSWPDDNTVKVLTVVSAKEFAEPSLRKSRKEYLESLAKDKIVLIGGSHAEGKDSHITPLGEMPGGLVLINAINSLLEHGEMTHLPVWQTIILTIMFIFIMSLLFTFFHSFDAMILSGGVVILVFVPLSLYWLGEGIWLDFALPLLVVEYHHLMNEVKGNKGNEVKGKGKDEYCKEEKTEINREG